MCEKKSRGERRLPEIQIPHLLHDACSGATKCDRFFGILRDFDRRLHSLQHFRVPSEQRNDGNGVHHSVGLGNVTK